MNFWVNPYELQPLFHCNSRHDKSPQRGVILKVEWPHGYTGYTDYHMSHNMGHTAHTAGHTAHSDSSMIHSVRATMNSPHFKHAVFHAWMDAKWRFERQSGFDSFSPSISTAIWNHCLILDVLSLTPTEFLNLRSRGYYQFKVKMGRHLKEETQKLRQLSLLCQTHILCQTHGSPPCPIPLPLFRLDFNESLQVKEFCDWLEKNGDLLRHIEFIEDPTPFEEKSWEFLSKNYPFQLALDMAASPMEVSPEVFHVLVLKPAIQNVKKVMDRYGGLDHSLVLTHYMDHPLGQSTAGWWACWARENFKNRVLSCGLQDIGVFEKDINMFSLDSTSPRFTPPKGLGWGFDNELAALDWIKL